MKGSFDNSRDGSTAEAKLKRLKKALQELDTLIIDAKYFAADIQLDDLTLSDSNQKNEAPKAYKRSSKSEDWGSEIDKTSFVYFILCPQVNAVKIGYTKNLRARISNLQTANPYRLKMLGWMYGARAEEKIVHEFFNRYHAGLGEWFFFEEDLLDYILDVIKTQPDFINPNEWFNGEASNVAFSQLSSSSLNLLEEAETFIEPKTIAPSKSASNGGKFLSGTR